MSKEIEEEDDERRLYRYTRKYEIIVKQYDELIEMMNNTTRPPKRRKFPSSCRGSNNATISVPASPSQPDNNEVFVQTVTKFLQDLQDKTDADFSLSTSARNRDGNSSNIFR